MRTIEFRGKREKDSEWVYGLLTYVVFQKSERQFEIHTPLYDSDGFRGIQRYAVFTESIGQFTGLLDKNGKEIYEGDIIKNIFKSKVQILVCVWEDEGFHFKYYKDKYNRFITNGEVIGNVFENGELLNG